MATMAAGKQMRAADVSAASDLSHAASEAEKNRRRIVLFHPQWHPQHRHAGLAVAGSADLATGFVHSQSARHRGGGWRKLSPREACRPSEPLITSARLSCKNCHSDLYERWSKTPMANVVRDPREHPDAIIPDLSQRRPAGEIYGKDDIAFVYGSKWKQRYFKKVGDDYFVLPAQWDVTHKKWKPYFVKDDWWAPLYPPDNFKRPTGALCDGCHSVNYDIQNQDGDGMERRLRKVPRAGQRACEAADEFRIS